MVFAANGAFSVDGVAYGARFRYAAAGRRGRPRTGPSTRPTRPWRFVAPRQTNEGEGDFAYLPGAYGGLVLAGHGFRTETAAHAEAQEVLGRPVVSLRLVDPRFYHLDVALAALDDHNIAYLPGGLLRRVPAGAAPALPRRGDRRRGRRARVRAQPGQRRPPRRARRARRPGWRGALAAAGYVPVPVELGEFKKGGGGVKCCVAELRPPSDVRADTLGC